MQKSVEKRVKFIKDILKNSGADGIVYGNSGGKDCALVSILCKMACENVLGIIMPCESSRNFNEDTKDALTVAKQYNIETVTVNITSVKSELLKEIEKSVPITNEAGKNIAPRLRMTTVYAIAQSRNALVAGTGNRSELFMGYFTKWGDGAYDFNPIADLTVTEVYEMLRYLNAPEIIINKAPSAGLFEGQTDESEMGVTYKQIDDLILNNKADSDVREKIMTLHNKTAHKRQASPTYSEEPRQ